MFDLFLNILCDTDQTVNFSKFDIEVVFSIVGKILNVTFWWTVDVIFSSI